MSYKPTPVPLNGSLPDLQSYLDRELNAVEPGLQANIEAEIDEAIAGEIQDNIDAAVATFVSGTYTPALTNGTNVAASTAFLMQYMRVGNTVTVSGRVDVDPTAASTLTQCALSLPVASNIGTLNLAGVGAGLYATGIQVAQLVPYDAENRALLEYYPAVTANQPFWVTFTYQIV